MLVDLRRRISLLKGEIPFGELSKLLCNDLHPYSISNANNIFSYTWSLNSTQLVVVVFWGGGGGGVSRTLETCTVECFHSETVSTLLLAIVASYMHLPLAM